MQSQIIKWKYVDDGAYFENLSIDYHLASIASIGPGVAADSEHASFF